MCISLSRWCSRYKAVLSEIWEAACARVGLRIWLAANCKPAVLKTYMSTPTCMHSIIVDKAGNQEHPVWGQLHHRINTGLIHHHRPRLFQRKLSTYIVMSADSALLVLPEVCLGMQGSLFWWNVVNAKVWESLDSFFLYEVREKSKLKGWTSYGISNLAPTYKRTEHTSHCASVSK